MSNLYGLNIWRKLFLLIIFAMITTATGNVARVYADDGVFGPLMVTQSAEVRVLYTDSPVLDKPFRKIRLESVTGPRPDRLSGCKPVDRLNQAGRAKCIVLSAGARYVTYGRDRNQWLERIMARVKVGDRTDVRTFFKDAQGNWRRASDGSRVLSQSAYHDLGLGQYTMVDSFEDAHFYVGVALDITTQGYVSYNCGSAAMNLPISGQMRVPLDNDIDVFTKYSTTAEKLARQMVSQSDKDNANRIASNAALQSINVMCSAGNGSDDCVVRLQRNDSSNSASESCQTAISDQPLITSDQVVPYGNETDTTAK